MSSQQGRVQKASRTFVSALVVQFVTQLCAFIATPLILSLLGDDRTGAYRAIGAWFGMLGLLELGVGGSFMTLANRAFSAGTDNDVEKAVGAGVLAFRRMTLRMVIGGVVLSALAPYLVPVEAELRIELILGCLFSTAALALTVFSPLNLILQAKQEAYVVNLAMIIQAVLASVLSVALAWANLGIASQAIATFVAALAFWSYLTTLFYYKRPSILMQLLRPTQEKQSAKELKQMSVPMFINRITAQIGMHNETIIVSSILSPAMVVPLFVTQRLPSIAAIPLRNIGDSAWAGIAELYNLGELERLRKRTYDLCSIIATLGVIGLLPVIFYNHVFMSLWVGAEHYAGDAFTILAGINILTFSVISYLGWLFGGTGKISLMLPASIAGGVVNLIVSVVFTYTSGVIGPLVGNFVGIAIVQGGMTAFLCREHFGLSLRSLLNSVIRPICIAALLSPLVWITSHSHDIGWVLLVLELFCWSGVLLFICWFFGISREQRQMFARILKLDKLTAKFPLLAKTQAS